jgi:hypothetical protein
MPKLIRRREEQRLGMGGAQEVENVRGAGATFAALERFGSGVSQVGASIMNYDMAREKADLDLKSAEFGLKAKVVHQQALELSLQSPNLAEDASNLDAIYQEGFKPLIAEAGTLKDPRQRQVAISKIENEMLAGYTEVIKQRQILHNKYHFKKTDELARMGGDLVINNPFTFPKVMQELEEHVRNSPMNLENKQKALEGIRKHVTTSTIQGFVEQNNFDGARKAVDALLGGQLDVEERKKLVKEIDKAHNDFLKDYTTREAKEAARTKLQSEMNRINAYNDVLNANFEQDPAKQELSAKRLRGLADLGIIRKSHLAAAEVGDDDVDFGVSEDTYNAFTMRLDSGKRNAGFVDDVMDAVAAKRLQPSAAQDLLGDYNKLALPVSVDKAAKVTYTEEKSVAKQLMADAFVAAPGERFDVFGVEVRKRKAKQAATRQLMLSNQKKGMQPTKAFFEALKVADPTNYLLQDPAPPLLSQEFEQKVSELRADQDKLNKFLTEQEQHKRLRDAHKMLQREGIK